MVKISSKALEEVKAAFEEYKKEIEAAGYASATKGTYINRAEYFVRWLNGDFEPGEGLADR